MQNQSERKRLIERLKKDKSERIEIPKEVEKEFNAVDKNDYIILAEHWQYLMKKQKEVDESKKAEIADRIFQVQAYMMIAKSGDRNIGRFNEV